MVGNILGPKVCSRTKGDVSSQDAKRTNATKNGNRWKAIPSLVLVDGFQVPQLRKDVRMLVRKRFVVVVVDDDDDRDKASWLLLLLLLLLLPVAVFFVLFFRSCFC